MPCGLLSLDTIKSTVNDVLVKKYLLYNQTPIKLFKSYEVAGGVWLWLSVCCVLSEGPTQLINISKE